VGLGWGALGAGRGVFAGAWGAGEPVGQGAVEAGLGGASRVAIDLSEGDQSPGLAGTGCARSGLLFGEGGWDDNGANSDGIGTGGRHGREIWMEALVSDLEGLVGDNEHGNGDLEVFRRLPPRRRRVRVGIGRNELSEGSSKDFPEVESDEDNHEEEGDENGSIENQTGLKWEFRDGTWKNPNFMYKPMPQEFSGNQRGPSTFYCTLPTFIHLFELFWTPTIMNAICRRNKPLCRGAISRA
jgi:hypothetical protein